MGISEMMRAFESSSASKVLEQAEKARKEIKYSDLLLSATMLLCAEGGTFEDVARRAYGLKLAVEKVCSEVEIDCEEETVYYQG